MKRIFITMLISVLFLAVSAEISDKFLNQSLYSPSLLDLNNISMNHTVSFSAGMSSNNQSFYQSVYTNHLNYRISSKLHLNLDLNFINFGTASFDRKLDFEANGDNESTILPEFSLSFKPSDSFSIVFEYRNCSLDRSWYNSNQWYRK
ncbi:MAG: hypothetical protein APR54_08075 [Candidatus Cloacimonas sp. SDB]|nr:MAG: hypothetical protein APR54_08075 [Candidatus Cloacimonas sp. SDB]